MRPMIGITAYLSDDETTVKLARTYVGAVIKAGAVPVILPITGDDEIIREYAAQIDGLLLTGGADVNPQVYGETADWACGDVCPIRDAFEVKLIQTLLQDSVKPILGICRGFQVLNAALGGTLYQDIRTCVEGKTLSHRQKPLSMYVSHEVVLSPDTQLYTIYGTDRVMVNSMHHQAAKTLAAGFTQAATAPDGIIEAAVLDNHPYCIGVQWHPERLYDQPQSEIHGRLFESFVKACIQQK